MIDANEPHPSGNEASRVDNRVMLPEVFDQMFKDPVLSRRVHACLSTSLGEIKRSIRSQDYIKIDPRFAGEDPINVTDIAISPDLNQSLFNERHWEGNEWLTRNRRYGLYHASLELAAQFDPSLPQRLIHTGLIHEIPEILGITRELTNHSKIEKAIVAKFATRSDSGREQYQKLLIFFGGQKRLFEYLNQCKDRGGVQVILGNDGFIDFLRGSRPKQIDDQAARIIVPIPNEFILYLLPLGLYERRELLK